VPEAAEICSGYSGRFLATAARSAAAALVEAAEKEGLGVSSWMLSVALREIQRTASAPTK
jgi:uncharacterized protein (DUF1778 family)